MTYNSQDINCNGEPYTKIKVRRDDTRDEYRGINDDSPSLNDHPFAQFMAAESFVSNSERAWLRWAKRVERCLGHDLDGNQEWDGYSLDYAHDDFLAGVTVPEYVEDVMIRKIALINIGG